MAPNKSATNVNLVSDANTRCPIGTDSMPAQNLDVSAPFLTHPGGQTTLDMARTSRLPEYHFLMYHLGFDLDGKIKKSCEARNINFPKRGPFYEDLHQAMLKVRKEHPEQTYIYQAYCLFLTVALPLTVVYWMTNTPSYGLDFTVAALMVSYFFNIYHMRHHKGSVLYRGHNWLNAITDPLYTFIDNIYGIQPAAWIKNHQDSHHLMTNDALLDNDVVQPHPFLRLNPALPLSGFHKLQTVYAPIVFMGVSISYPFDNLLKWKSHKMWFVTWLVINWVVPFYFNGWSGPGHCFLMYFMTGVALSYLFQVSHNHGDLGDKMSSIATIDKMLMRQCQESMSWGGWWSGLIFGGINYQTEHHICPAHDPTLYHYFAPEVARVCKKHGVSYTYESTFGGALMQYHKWLYTMGNADSVEIAPLRS